MKVGVGHLLFSIGLNPFSPGVPLPMMIVKSDGKSEEIKMNHTCNEQQIEWFKAGSALNIIKAKEAV